MSDRLGATVIVLAGGRSSRFGSPKLEAELDGRPLLDHVLALARQLSDDVVLAVAPGSSPGPRPGGEPPPDVRLVQDGRAFGGPLAGLAAGLESVEREIVIVLAGDMPRVGMELVEPLLLTLVTYPDVAAVVLERAGANRPLPLVGRAEPLREHARALLAGEGEHSLRALLAAVTTRAIPEPHWTALDPTGRALADVDRPEDLEALR